MDICKFCGKPAPLVGPHATFLDTDSLRAHLRCYHERVEAGSWYVRENGTTRPLTEAEADEHRQWACETYTKP